MGNKKVVSEKEKPDEWVTLAMSVLKQINFNYQNYDQERGAIVVNSKIYERMKELSNEFRSQNIV